jgi:hypothetical protein
MRSFDAHMALHDDVDRLAQVPLPRQLASGGERALATLPGQDDEIFERDPLKYVGPSQDR